MPGDRRGVSPTVGVVLMVAITVVLAAVVGTTVLGSSSGLEEVPSASFEYEPFNMGDTPQELRIRFVAGDRIDNDELSVTFADNRIQQESGSPGPADELTWRELGDGGDLVVASDYVEVEPPDPPETNGKLSGKTIQIVWDSGEESYVLDTWTLD